MVHHIFQPVTIQKRLVVASASLAVVNRPQAYG
ncbi:hypothetical protein MTBSS4_210016 [Magnetospirillum sp. SS-4]|nr:hypothetical protein MTBSS4_210016 [Magnetospirillum sp. SS-4]